MHIMDNSNFSVDHSINVVYVCLCLCVCVFVCVCVYVRVCILSMIPLCTNVQTRWYGGFFLAIKLSVHILETLQDTNYCAMTGWTTF